MEFITHSHRNATEVFQTEGFRADWEEFQNVLKYISDTNLSAHFKAKYQGKQKSLAHTINDLIRERLVADGWTKEPPIFKDKELRKEKTWRLDFAKNDICVEVAFNHGEATAWNLFKPVLSSELNHVEKAIQTKGGIVVFVTEEMKVAGGFDGAVMTFERVRSHLRAFHNLIPVPLMIIGLKAPKSFLITQLKENGKKRGYIKDIQAA
jgi:hypothetical protein